MFRQLWFALLSWIYGPPTSKTRSRERHALAYLHASQEGLSVRRAIEALETTETTKAAETLEGPEEPVKKQTTREAAELHRLRPGAIAGCIRSLSHRESGSAGARALSDRLARYELRFLPKEFHFSAEELRQMSPEERETFAQSVKMQLERRQKSTPKPTTA